MPSTVMVGSATCLVLVALIFVALSFGTDNWIEYTVDRDSLKLYTDVTNDSLYHDPIYFTRYRGLFRTCYPGTETYFLEDDEYVDLVVDNTCLEEQGYEITQNPETIGYGDDYTVRKHLMRAHVGMTVVALFFLLAAVFTGATGCWILKDSLIQNAGILSFLGAFFGAGGVALFHGYEYLEKQKINEEPFPKSWHNPPNPLAAWSSFNYGYSYILADLGLGVALLAALLFLCAGCYVNDWDRYDDEDDYGKGSRPEKRRRRKRYHRNAAYEQSEMPPIPVIAGGGALPAIGYDYPTYGGPSAIVQPEYAGSKIGMVPMGDYGGSVIAYPVATGDYGTYSY